MYSEVESWSGGSMKWWSACGHIFKRLMRTAHVGYTWKIAQSSEKSIEID